MFPGVGSSPDPAHEGVGQAGPASVLAHELAHAWQGQFGYPEVFIPEVGRPPAAWDLGIERWYNEYFAVMAQNYAFLEMARPNWRDPASWGRKSYDGVDMPRWNRNPFKGLPACGCDEYFDQASDGGWGAEQ